MKFIENTGQMTKFEDLDLGSVFKDSNDDYWIKTADDEAFDFHTVIDSIEAEELVRYYPHAVVYLGGECTI